MKKNYILIILVVILLGHNFYLQTKIEKVFIAAKNAEYNSDHAADYASDAASNSKDAADYAEKAANNAEIASINVQTIALNLGYPTTLSID